MGRLAVCVCWPHAEVPTAFVQSLWASDIPKDSKLVFSVSHSAAMARNKAVRECLDDPEIDEMLFFDVDQTFPEEIYGPLHGADVDIISGFVPMDKYPHAWCVWKKTDDGTGEAHFIPFDEGVHEVWKVGSGCLLVKRGVFDKIGAPWFPVDLNAEHSKYNMTSDIHFCDKARAAGIKIHAHAGVCPGHVRTVVLTREYSQRCIADELIKQAKDRAADRARIEVPGRRSIYVPA